MRTFQTRKGMVSVVSINGEKTFILPSGMTGESWASVKDAINDELDNEGDTSKP